MARPALGSILHLCGEQFKALAGGLNIAHVPYRGSAPMMSDLVGGQISMAFDATPTALPQAQSGAIRAIGAGMATRMRAMPELPTLQEQGLKGFECYTWNAILAPAGTPAPIVDRLNEAINTALDDPAVLNRLQDAGIDPTPGQHAASKRPSSSRQSSRNGRRSSRLRARRSIEPRRCAFSATGLRPTARPGMTSPVNRLWSMNVRQLSQFKAGDAEHAIHSDRTYRPGIHSRGFKCGHKAVRPRQRNGFIVWLRHI